MIILIALAAALSSAVLTGLLRRYALRSGLIDRPNARSSHEIPTPRGGGLAIVTTFLVAMSTLFFVGQIPVRLFAALGGGGLAVAIAGFIDDRHTLPAGVRFAVHVCAAVWCLAWLGGLPALMFNGRLVDLGWAGDALGVLAIVWVLNLFNFMDGIDGIAASEAVFVVAAAAGLTLLGPRPDGLLVVEIVFVAACAGFLWWNWPPAQIFMGDVGSGFVGYMVAVLALASAREDPAAIWKWLILGGVFFVDATVTLVRRAIRGDPIHEAHRSHAYQWLARRWRSHKRVTLTVVLLNLVWILPCAVLATRHSDAALWMVLVAFLPLVALAVSAGAGRREPALF